MEESTGTRLFLYWSPAYNRGRFNKLNSSTVLKFSVENFIYGHHQDTLLK